MRVPFGIFGKTKMVPLITYTGGKIDDPPKQTWDDTLWIERGEDWYALLSPQMRNKTVLVVERMAWIASPERE